MIMKIKIMKFTTPAFFTILLLFSLSASAGKLKNFVADLYGGDGISLNPGNIFHQAHFTSSSLSAFDSLGNDINSSINNFPFNSTVTGYSFNVATGLPVKGGKTLGPLIAELATTLGKGTLNIGFSYIHIDYDDFNGKSLDDLSLTFAHDDLDPVGLGNPAFEEDVVAVNLDLELERQTFALQATFGLTDNWDIGVIIPIVRMKARARATASVIQSAANNLTVHRFDENFENPNSSAGGTETGIGDIILRSKYNLIKDDAVLPDTAFVGTLTLPSGDEDDLIGSGDVGFEFLFAASKSYDWLTPHINLGYEVSSGNETKENFRYIVGVDAHFFEQFTTAVDIIGNWRPYLDGEGDNLVDVAFQTKWNPFGNTLINGFVIIPINGDDGLRSDAIWSVGIEQVF